MFRLYEVKFEDQLYLRLDRLDQLPSEFVTYFLVEGLIQSSDL